MVANVRDAVVDSGEWGGRDELAAGAVARERVAHRVHDRQYISCAPFAVRYVSFYFFGAPRNAVHTIMGW